MSHRAESLLCRAEEAIAYLDTLPMHDLPDDARCLLHLLYSLIMVSFPIEIWRQPYIPDTGTASFELKLERHVGGFGDGHADAGPRERRESSHPYFESVIARRQERDDKRPVRLRADLPGLVRRDAADGNLSGRHQRARLVPYRPGYGAGCGRLRKAGCRDSDQAGKNEGRTAHTGLQRTWA